MDVNIHQVSLHWAHLASRASQKSFNPTSGQKGFFSQLTSHKMYLVENIKGLWMGFDYHVCLSRYLRYLCVKLFHCSFCNERLDFKWPIVVPWKQSNLSLWNFSKWTFSIIEPNLVSLRKPLKVWGVVRLCSLNVEDNYGLSFSASDSEIVRDSPLIWGEKKRKTGMEDKRK